MTEPNHQDIALGRRIRLRRKLLQMSQRDLGKLCGDVSFQQIQKYENGTNRVSFSRLRMMAAALQCTVQDLAGEDEDPETAVALQEESETAMRGASKLLDVYMRLTPKRRALLLTLATELACRRQSAEEVVRPACAHDGAAADAR